MQVATETLESSAEKAGFCITSFRLIEDWLNAPDKAATPVSSPARLIEMYES